MKMIKVGDNYFKEIESVVLERCSFVGRSISVWYVIKVNGVNIGLDFETREEAQKVVEEISLMQALYVSLKEL